MRSALLLALIVSAIGVLPPHCLAQNYLITTVAGGGVPITPAPATSIPLAVTSLAAGAHGDLYIAASNYVFQMNSAGILTRVAGTSAPGYSGDGGFATNARIDFRFYTISGIAVDATGNVYIAQGDDNVVRKVSAATGMITTVAGGGQDLGDGGPATSASVATPASIAVDGFGNLYIAEGQAGRVRKVSAATGIITTVAGNGTSQFDTGDGGPATAAGLNGAQDIAVDGSGNLYIMTGIRVRKVNATTGIITTVAGTGQPGESGDGGPATSAQISGNILAVDGAGDIYIPGASGIRKVTAATGIIATVAGTAGLSGLIAVDGEGNLYIGDQTNNLIHKVPAATGIISTIAGNGQSAPLPAAGVATFAQLGGPAGVAVDTSGNVYFTDTNMVWKLAPATGMMTQIAGTGATGYTGDGGPATAATFNGAGPIAVDSSGNVYIADYRNSAIRKVTAATGLIATVAGPASTPPLGLPSGVAVDTSGNIFTAYATGNFTISVVKITPAGVFTTVETIPFGPFNVPPQPLAVFALDAAGNLFIGNGYMVQEVAAATGVITTVAGTSQNGYSGDGGPATQAAIGAISGVAVDSAGNLYIDDSENNVIRKVTAGGIISTIAGEGPTATLFSGDGGPATSAELSLPAGVAVDSNGNLFIADTGNQRIRMLLPENTRSLLNVTKTHTAGFTMGQSNATYSITLSNAPNAGAASGAVTVNEIIPPGLTLESMSGTGWSCSATASCTRSDTLGPGSSYPLLTVTVNVAQDGPPQAINQITMTAGNSAATSAIDTTGILPNAAQRAVVTTVSAASGAAPVTADSIVSMYAVNIATAVSTATSGPPAPLPLALSGVSATITDSAGAKAPVGLIVVTPAQVNAVLPPGLAPGVATIDLVSSTGVPILGDVSLVNVAPSLFTADETGRGTAAAQEVIAHADGSQTFVAAIAACTSNGCSATPLSLGSGTDQAVLELFGTGIRGAGGAAGVSVMVGNTQGDVLYAGPQGGGGAGSYYGLDQVNVLLPRTLTGAGTVDVVLTAGGQTANTVTVEIQ